MAGMARRAGTPRAIRGLTAGRFVGGAAIAALGVLVALAVASEPLASLLLLAPLAFLRWSHQAFLSMRADRARLAEIVSRSTDGIFTVDGSGVIESWNPAMESMTGSLASDVVGIAGMARFAPRDAEGKLVRFDRWTSDGIPAEVLISTPCGERWLGLSSAVGGGGEPLVIVARDVTRAREIDRMKDDFIATVSHELRTPLATIRGFTELLEPPNALGDDVRSQVLARIRNGTHRLERLVANLLEVSRIDARSSAGVVATELDLVAVVARVVDEVQESWPDRQILVDVGSGGWRVHGDLLSLERILVNLLSNALTYADTGPVHLAIRSDAHDGVEVSVRDHGPGISPQDQARIFERFERIDTPNQKAGTGLGLYISRGLASGMGAEIQVESRPGEGAEFTLRLPPPTRRGTLIDLIT